MEENILFTGEFNPAVITKGFDEMIATMDRAKKTQAELTATMESNEAIRQDSAEGIKKLTAQIAALDKTNKDYLATNAQLNSRLAALKGQYDKYTATIEKQNKELETSRAALAKMTAGYDAAKKSVTELQAAAGKPIAMAMNDGKLTATIGGIREKAKQMGIALTDSLDSSKSSIDNVTQGAANLGMIWGPLGLAAGTALGTVVRKLYEMSTALTEGQIRAKFLAEEMKKVQGYRDEAVSSMAKETTAIELLVKQLQTETLSKQQRNEAISQLQSLAPEYFAVLDKEKATIEDITRAYDNYTAGIRKAIEAKVTEKQLNDVIDQRLALEQKSASRTNSIVGKDGKVVKSINATYDQNERRSAIEDLRRSQEGTAMLFDDEYQRWKNLKDSEDMLLKKLVDLEGGRNLIKTTKEKATDRTREVQNIYQQELEKLKAAMAKIDEKAFTDEASITKALSADFGVRKAAYTKAFKKGQLSESELNDLNERLKVLYGVTLNKNIKDFQEARAKYIQGINDTLSTIEHEEHLKRISTIQNNFERERQTIIAETDKTIEAAKQKRDKTIADIEKNAPKNGLRPEEIEQIGQIKRAYSDLLDDLEIIRNQKLQRLSFDTFEKLSEDAKRLLDSGNLGVSQGSLIKIQELTAQYQAGKLSYASYQKELTQIARDEANQRFQIEKQFLEAEIRTRQAKLATDKSLTDDQIKRLEDEIRRLKQQLTDAEKGNIITNTVNGQSDKERKINELLNYVSVIKSVADSVVSFWQRANEAEQQSLSRSIALQDRRVEAARNVAAKGNAEYLRMEEEKQQQLQIQQENAARRTLAVNAAVQGSQLLVALISGIAEGAKQGGAIGALVSVGAIVAAIAGAYAIAQSLKPQQPSFFVGTEDTGPGGNADNKGGFHSILHPHERVMTADENKKLKGLSNREVVELVQKSRVFVEQWKAAPTPSLNVAAMEMASGMQSSEITALMHENNRELRENKVLQEKILKALKGMGVSFKWDKNGAALSILETVEEIQKSKKM